MTSLTPASALPYSWGVFGAYSGITSVSATGVIANVIMFTFEICSYADVH